MKVYNELSDGIESIPSDNYRCRTSQFDMKLLDRHIATYTITNKHKT